MAIALLLVLASLLFFSDALPSELIKRDPCDGVNASPVLYHEYSTADCPPKTVWMKIDDARVTTPGSRHAKATAKFVSS